MLSMEQIVTVNNLYRNDKEVMLEAVLSQYDDSDTLEIEMLKALAKKYSYLTMKRFRRLLTSQLDSYILSTRAFESY